MHQITKSKTTPQFLPQVKIGTCPNEKGFTIYYSDQCPFTSYYIPLLNNHIISKGFSSQVIHYSTLEMARNGPSPFSTSSIYMDGKFLTHELLLPQKFDKMFEKLKD